MNRGTVTITGNGSDTTFTTAVPSGSLLVVPPYVQSGANSAGQVAIAVQNAVIADITLSFDVLLQDGGADMPPCPLSSSQSLVIAYIYE